MLAALLVALVLSADPVPCQTVADCWLDADSRPIARPKKLRGKPIPKGDCGRKLQWLRHKLACEQNVCTVTNVGDGC